jgi:hypothetical protein
MTSRKTMKKWPSLSEDCKRELTIDIKVIFHKFVLIMMVLVILLKNVLTRKIREMKNMIQIENKHIKAKEPKRKSLRNVYAPKKTTPD